MTKWTVHGRASDAAGLAETLALNRSHKKRAAQADREARDREINARAVGRAIRRSEREQQRYTIGCRPAPKRGQCAGRVRLRVFQQTLGLQHPVDFSSSSGRASSFHLKFTPRGLGSHRRNERPYSRGEVVRAVRYIFRESAREFDGDGIVSNISQSPDDIAALLAALEELELTAGRKNANVYTSVVISLPHELDGNRRELLREICQPLADLKLPYAAALHLPDARGDQRNNHAHILFSWRPFRHADVGYEFSAGARGAENTPAFVTDFRSRAADAMNRAMARAGKRRQFTAEKRGRANTKPSDAKRTPGQSAALRREEALTGLKEKRASLGALQAVLARARTVITSLIELDHLDWRPHLNLSEQRELALQAAAAQLGETPSAGDHMPEASFAAASADQLRVKAVAPAISHAKSVAPLPATADPLPAAEGRPISPSPISHEKSISVSAKNATSNRSSQSMSASPSSSAAAERGPKPKKENADGRYTQRELDEVVAAARNVFGPPEPDLHGLRAHSTPGSPQELRQLSSVPFLQDQPGAPVLLQGATAPLLRPDSASDHSLRRSGDDACDAAGDVSSGLITSQDRPTASPEAAADIVAMQPNVAADPLTIDTADVVGRVATSATSPSAASNRPEPSLAKPSKVSPITKAVDPHAAEENVRASLQDSSTSENAKPEARKHLASAAQSPLKAEALARRAINTAKDRELLKIRKAQQEQATRSIVTEALSEQPNPKTSGSPRSDELIRQLRSLEHLPLCPVREDVEGRERSLRFSLEPEFAIAEDQDLIRQAQKLQDEQQIQAALRAHWEAFLARLRASADEKNDPGHQGNEASSLPSEQRFQAAFKASDSGSALAAGFDIRREQRKAVAAKMYPPLEAAKTRTGKLFLKVLLNGGTKAEIYEAAKAVSEVPIALEDVKMHGVKLAVAYEEALERGEPAADQRDLNRIRPDGLSR